MAALIKFSIDGRWVPLVDGSRDNGRERSAVLAGHVPPIRQFDFGFMGKRFDPADVRIEFWLKTNHRTLADVLPVVGSWGCSAEFRDIVEAFEPGLHQFFPITLRRPSGKPILRLDGREVGPGQYFIMNPLQQIEALLPEHCVAPWGERRKTVRGVMPDVDDLCVSRAAIEGRHLWLNKPYIGSGLIFISDALGAALREKGLKGFVMKPVREA
ncbi:imm11 family protein [Roseomonas fluvialis]|uniref:Immunity MXAN-0049 protein domain-containing protein n=1 Tax=Roseomonas fluvialis TaxID=1750527 RepID=A0ABN6PAE4_9PROT|nr:DUF1629 domain-containing protein [Roseomonas fluvialis]BDG75096.1 hypothetical protein Rmf_50250 [Roseomonas fluvialis]